MKLISLEETYSSLNTIIAKQEGQGESEWEKADLAQ